MDESFIGVCCLVNKRRVEILMDTTDLPLLGRYTWSYRLCNGHEYVMCGSKKYQPFGFLHRHLLGAKKGQSVDHINGNGLDNRRCNIRLCTHGENMCNRKLHKNNKTGFKGVTFHDKGRFRAHIRANGRTRYLGLFQTAQEAHAAYRAAAVSLHGEFARFE